jgi:hypothetical protein
MVENVSEMLQKRLKMVTQKGKEKPRKEGSVKRRDFVGGENPIK